MIVLRVHLDVHKLTLITSLTDFGNYQDPMVIKKAKGERHKFGSFYYRFPHGESASDVVSIFFYCVMFEKKEVESDILYHVYLCVCYL